MVYTNLLMDLKASSSVLQPWAVVLAVCAVGFLSSCAQAAPLILQLDSTSLLGHRLVVAIEPLLDGVTTPTTTEANTTVILLNTTAGATNGSIIYFDSNSIDSAVTVDGPEIASADDTTTEAGLPPTSTAAAVIVDGALVAAEVRSEKYDHFTEEDHNATSFSSEYSAQPEDENISKLPMGMNELPVIRTRMRPMDNVDNFLINFPKRCPPGWRVEHGQCRRPFNHVNDLAKPRKAKPKRKIKMMT